MIQSVQQVTNTTELYQHVKVMSLLFKTLCKTIVCPANTKRRIYPPKLYVLLRNEALLIANATGSNPPHILPSNVCQVETLQTCIQEMPVSNLGQETDCHARMLS